MLSLICFSKDRPLQLEGCLRALKARLLEPEQVAIHVLLYEQPLYAQAYAELESIYPDVNVVRQTNFAADIRHILEANDSEFVCFYCDDVVAIRSISIKEAASVLVDSDVIGVSLRLGRDIHHGFFPTPMRQPGFCRAGAFLTWDMTEAHEDWCYPWDVLGTIYRAEFVRDMWSAVEYAHNPSEFEELGSRAWSSVTSQSRYACWFTPRTVVPTINVTQQVFPNGVIGPNPISTELLLACWYEGLRLDVQRYAEHDYDTWRIGDLFLSRVG